MEIEKFNRTTMRKDCVSVIIGRRSTGKTTLAKNLLWFKKGKKFIINSNESVSNDYAGVTRPEMIHDTYSEELLKHTIDYQERTQRLKTMHVVLDDCLFSMREKDQLWRLFVNGRHLNMSTTVCASHTSMIDTFLYANVDYVFILRCTNTDERRKLFQRYSRYFYSFHEFASTLDSMKPYECLVIDNTRGRIFSYCASQTLQKISDTLKHPYFASQLRTIGRTHRLKTELIFVTSLIPNG